MFSLRLSGLPAGNDRLQEREQCQTEVSHGRLRLGDFDHSILDVVAHRPWPMPSAPWIMTQTWNDLLFAHWPMEPAAVRTRVPAPLTIDLFEGRAWVGIVPFHMTNVAPRFVPPLPWVSAFPELNVRTYVTAGGKPGVYFFSLDATNSLAVAAARTFFHLPYFGADMAVVPRGEAIGYASHRTGGGADFVGSYRPVGGVFEPQPGTLEYFLTERYCLHTVDPSGRVRTVDIHHPPWPLQQAEADISTNSMADAAGLSLPDIQPLLHFAKRQDMVCWPLM
jgi:uncharacterized protein YqjF (DUF2071 family)